MNRQTDSWVRALDGPDRGHAADDLARIVAEVDAMWTRLSRIHDLIARAGDGEARRSSSVPAPTPGDPSPSSATTPAKPSSTTSTSTTFET